LPSTEFETVTQVSTSIINGENEPTSTNILLTATYAAETESNGDVNVPSPAAQSSVDSSSSETGGTYMVSQTSTTTQAVALNPNYSPSSLVTDAVTKGVCDCTKIVTITYTPVISGAAATSMASSQELQSPTSSEAKLYSMPPIEDTSSSSNSPGFSSSYPTSVETPSYPLTTSSSASNATVIYGPTNASYGTPPAPTTTFAQVNNGGSANNIKLAFLVGFLALAVLV
jgi:hypothetical protein